MRDFPAEIARLALIIAEYQFYVHYRGQQEALAAFLPLEIVFFAMSRDTLAKYYSRSRQLLRHE